MGYERLEKSLTVGGQKREDGVEKEISSVGRSGQRKDARRSRVWNQGGTESGIEEKQRKPGQESMAEP